jgi:DNA phosphorothioation-dependent restriction protein DptG
MKHIQLFEAFINESTTDGTIESLIKVTQISMSMGIFDDRLLKNSKYNLISGVNGALKSETLKLPTDKRKEFNGYVDALMKPLQKADTMEQFLGAMINVADTKNNIFSRLSIIEKLNESKVLDLLKKVKNATTEWWNNHKDTILLSIAEILAQILVEILFGILRALLKSDKLKAPKMNFGGGAFSGGGSGGSY